MSLRERWGFTVAGFGQNLLYNFVALYLLVFLVEGVGLSTRGIAIATAVITGAKVWDAVFDLAIGTVIDRTRTRWGRFRPWILGTAVPLLVLVTLLFFVPPWSQTARLFWFGICYVLFASMYTLSDVPYWSMTSVITTDARSRTRLIAWARTAGAVSLAVITLAGVPLARLLSFSSQTTSAGWFRAAVLTSVVGVGLFSLAFLSTTEKIKPSGDPVRLRETLRAIGQSTPLFLLLLSGALGFGRFVLQVGGAVVALVVFGDEQLFTLLGAALIVAMIASTMATPWLLTFTNRRSLMITSSAVAVVTYLLMYLVGHSSLPAVMAVVFLSGLTLGVFTVTQTAMFADVTDHAEVRTGQRMDGVCFAGLTFVAKLCSALATVVFGLAVAAVGYSKGTEVTESMRSGLWLVTTVVPAISVALSIVPLLFYRVPEKDLPQLLAQARGQISEQSAAVGS